LPVEASRLRKLLESRRFLGDVFYGYLKRTLRDNPLAVGETFYCHIDFDNLNTHHKIKHQHEHEDLKR
jgi:hypothetical protein